jgi:ribokinase
VEDDRQLPLFFTSPGAKRRMSVSVLGSINLDIVCQVERLPRPGETVTSLRVDEFPGGKGGNQAVASAKMGAATTLIAALGQDAAATGLKQFLVRTGVGLSSVVEIAERPTGRAFISVDAKGENVIVVDAGANAALTPAHLTTEALAGHAVFLAQLETPIETLAAFYRSEPAKAGLKLLNAAPAIRGAEALFPLIDILITNETELAVYARLEGAPVDLDAIATAARCLLDRADQAVVVTLGAAGVALITPDDAVAMPSQKVKVVDTTGAGDCFCGVLAALLSEGANLTDALKQANAAGALAVGRAGASTSMPTRAELKAFLQA